MGEARTFIDNLDWSGHNEKNRRRGLAYMLGTFPPRIGDTVDQQPPLDGTDESESVPHNSTAASEEVGQTAQEVSQDPFVGPNHPIIHQQANTNPATPKEPILGSQEDAAVSSVGPIDDDWDDQDVPSGTTADWDNSEATTYSKFTHPSRSGNLTAWTAPLAFPSKSIKFTGAIIDATEYQFLTAFLSSRRRIDFTFEARHQLITYLLTTIQSACYSLMREHFPSELDLLQILNADELDMFDWLALLDVSLLPSTPSLARL